MKKIYTLILCFLICIVTACEEMEYDHVLIVVTNEGVDRPEFSDAATLKGAILDVGNLKVTNYGFCYSISAPGLNLTLETPNVKNILAGQGASAEVGEFERKIYGLEKQETYAYRAYAKTDSEVKYGKQYTFNVGDITTPVFSAQVNNISKTTATALGSVSENQLAAVGGAIQEHGHCWSAEPTPEITDPKTILGALTAAQGFTSNISGLAAGTTYYVRAYIIPTGSTTPIYSNNEVEIKTVQ
ncbi:hypothetical protein GXP67_03715 [Rhodocytophaga rosea]|uniref:DUF4493 domain-containing protein n=1 Tax=Rhodocytophaga rosea TaxID=2704465 RepID=A0A6C0GDE8_9BACT|nr:hypothetical protein [Rhodocytophaga rosea]QHT65834.1 hypothetical protein GXP67_03715 [Rhodocytophaga rosea]